MKATFLFLGAMELLKLQLLASYGFLLLENTFPFLPASLAFFLSLGSSRYLRRMGMRVFLYALIELTAFAAAFLAIYSAYRGSWFDPASFRAMDDLQWTSFFAVLGTSAVFWLRAAWLERQEADHGFCATRFDEGIALFLLALGVTALVKVENPFPGQVAVPYFIFGILALGISKSEGARRGGLSASSRKAMTASLALVFVLASAGIFLLVPSLTEPARRAAESLKGASLSLLRLIADFLTWLFRGRRPTFAAPRESDRLGPGILPERMGEESAFSAILMWIMLGAAGIVILLLLGYLAAWLWRFLMSRTRKPGEAEGSGSLGSWLKGIMAALTRLLSWLAALPRRLGLGRLPGRRSAALEAYARLLAGGRAAGAARKPSETPGEFARRLAAAFPATAGQAAFIAEQVEKEVYGGLAADPATAARLAGLRARTGRLSFIAERFRRSLRNLRARPVRPAHPKT